MNDYLKANSANTEVIESRPRTLFSLLHVRSKMIVSSNLSASRLIQEIQSNRDHRYVLYSSEISTENILRYEIKRFHDSAKPSLISLIKLFKIRFPARPYHILKFKSVLDLQAAGTYLTQK